jgi:hypothetical protein
MSPCPSEIKPDAAADALENCHAAGTLRAELLAHCERFAEAEQRAQSARVYQQQGERAAAEAESMEAAGAYHAASRALADLFLLLLRHAKQHCPDALRTYFVELLRPELDELADAIVAVERGSR